MFISVLEIESGPAGSACFGPPGSGSGLISQRYGSGSGSFPFLINVLSGRNNACQINFNTKIFAKNKNFQSEDDVPVRKLKEKIYEKNIFFASLKSIKKVVGSGAGSISQRYRSGDPDPDPYPHQNVTDPQHWISYWSVIMNIHEHLSYMYIIVQRYILMV